jgi:hypothetical protein
MHHDFLVKRLSDNIPAIEGLLRGVSQEQSLWRPAPEKWSILEIVNHLIDEERDDFRARLDLTLHHPGQPWPSLNPEALVKERNYQGRDLDESIENFLMERRATIAWLKGLGSPDWNLSYPHPRAPGGAVHAGDLLAGWVAHDFLHIRQLGRIHWEYLTLISAPYHTGYGGPMA